MALSGKFFKLNLKYQDSQEEQEFTQIKMPLIKQFFQYLFIAITGVLIPYSIRYFLKHLFPQNYIIIALMVVALFIFLIRQKLQKHLEHLLFGYIILVIGLFTTVCRELFTNQDPGETFYMGYAYAMIHRLVGYRVIKVKYTVLLYIFSIALKFPMISNPDPVLIIIVLVLDFLTVIFSYKSENVERSVFDSLYKSKKDIIKFKHLLTQYLPNQMAIFSKDYSETYYINNSFKRSFKCLNVLQAKDSLKKYIIDKDSVDKHIKVFTQIGFINQNADNDYSLSHFMACIVKNPDFLNEIGTFSFPIIEDTRLDDIMLAENPCLKSDTQGQKDNKQNKTSLEDKGAQKVSRQPSKTTKECSESQKKANVSEVNMNDNERNSSDRGTSKSHSSDFVLEEGMKRVYIVKIFPLVWDVTDAIAMVLDDISQQKVIMELKLADKNKDLVIAMVSHELRTPLNGLLGLLDIAKKHIEQADVTSYLNACKNSGVLMLNLINSILDMNQIKNKKLRLVHTKVNIRDLLDEIKSLFYYSCLLKNLYLNIDIDPNVPEIIKTDKNRLTQIFVNLLGNAFKFTFSGGITVKATLESSKPCKIKFAVEDTGIGINKEDQTRLFKMYGKLDHGDDKINTHGIGLGLTISDTLANLLNPLDNGHIQLESEVGKGTCFSFIVDSQSPSTLSNQDIDENSFENISSLLLKEDRDETILKKMSIYTINKKENFSKLTTSAIILDSRQAYRIELEEPLQLEATDIKNSDDNYVSKVKKPDHIQKKKDFTKKDSLAKLKREKEEEELQEGPWCLIVDDNPFNLMVACHIMQEKGYQVKTSLNGQESIERFKEHRDNGFGFKVVLMDCQMPVMDGYEATKILRNMMMNGEIPECPIIALTANSRDDDHDKLCDEVGMSGHVSKPLQIEELEAVLRKAQKQKK